MEDGASTGSIIDTACSPTASLRTGGAPAAESSDVGAAEEQGEGTARRPVESENGKPAEPEQQTSSGSSEQNQQQLFREMLKHPSAQPVVMQIKNFLQEFPPSGLTRSEAARRVAGFLSKITDWMLSDCVVFAADADEEGRTKAAEGLEKFVLTRLYPSIFGTDPSDSAEDEALHSQMSGLQWVSFSHLSGPEVDPSLLELAIKQLRSIADWKAPKDKLVCIINACKVINDVLKRSRDGNGRPLAADDFLPLLIFIVIQANPPRLHSNVEFVNSFRHPSRLVAEDAYYLTSLQSAIQFARDANSKALDVTPEEYEEHFEKSQREAKAAAKLEEMSNDPATVAEKAAALSPAQLAQLRARLKALPLTFEAVESARQLKVKDVATLLEEYREMARILRNLDDPGTPGTGGSPATPSRRN